MKYLSKKIISIYLYSKQKRIANPDKFDQVDDMT